jgi:hypothetical protein
MVAGNLQVRYGQGTGRLRGPHRWLPGRPVWGSIGGLELPTPPTLESKQQVGLRRRFLVQEKDMIETALKDTGGRVSGPTGAAVKLGMPRSSLKSKIRSLKINKKRFKV